jgi:hypothetical protein
MSTVDVEIQLKYQQGHVSNQQEFGLLSTSQLITLVTFVKKLGSICEVFVEHYEFY